MTLLVGRENQYRYTEFKFLLCLTFRTMKSKKCKPILLAFMLHSSRNSHQHQSFGEEIGKVWATVCKNRVVTAVLSDAEPALNHVFAVKFFISIVIVIRSNMILKCLNISRKFKAI